VQHAVHLAVLGMRASELRAFPPLAPTPALDPPLSGPTVADHGCADDSASILSRATEVGSGIGSFWPSTNSRQQADSHQDGRSEGSLRPAFAATAVDYSLARPLPVALSIKPFPWPAVKQDLGAAAAAAFFNLLLVCLCLCPPALWSCFQCAQAVTAGILPTHPYASYAPAYDAPDRLHANRLPNHCCARALSFADADH
jgi:hypothetical protein